MSSRISILRLAISVWLLPSAVGASLLAAALGGGLALGGFTLRVVALWCSLSAVGFGFSVIASARGVAYPHWVARVVGAHFARARLAHTALLAVAAPATVVQLGGLASVPTLASASWSLLLLTAAIGVGTAAHLHATDALQLRIPAVPQPRFFRVRGCVRLCVAEGSRQAAQALAFALPIYFGVRLGQDGAGLWVSLADSLALGAAVVSTLILWSFARHIVEIFMTEIPRGGFSVEWLQAALTAPAGSLALTLALADIAHAAQTNAARRRSLLEGPAAPLRGPVSQVAASLLRSMAGEADALSVSEVALCDVHGLSFPCERCKAWARPLNNPNLIGQPKNAMPSIGGGGWGAAAAAAAVAPAVAVVPPRATLAARVRLTTLGRLRLQWLRLKLLFSVGDAWLQPKLPATHAVLLLLDLPAGSFLVHAPAAQSDTSATLGLTVVVVTPGADGGPPLTSHWTGAIEFTDRGYRLAGDALHSTTTFATLQALVTHYSATPYYVALGGEEQKLRAASAPRPARVITAAWAARTWSAAPAYWSKARWVGPWVARACKRYDAAYAKDLREKRANILRDATATILAARIMSLLDGPTDAIQSFIANAAFCLSALNVHAQAAYEAPKPSDLERRRVVTGKLELSRVALPAELLAIQVALQTSLTRAKRAMTPEAIHALGKKLPKTFQAFLDAEP